MDKIGLNNLVDLKLTVSTLSVLIAGLYCTYNSVESIAIPESVYISIAEKLEYFLPQWDYERIRFEQWISNYLLILPKPMLSVDEIKELQENTLYWEAHNGNVILVISMDIGVINE